MAAAERLTGLSVSVGLDHPDYLPYFNALAGNAPERIVVDSDLDWGQDWKRAVARLHELGAREVAMLPRGAGREALRPPLEKLLGLSLIPVDPLTPAPGWNAIGLTGLLRERLGLFDERPEVRVWPETMKPTERIGKSILLYHVGPRR